MEIILLIIALAAVGLFYYTNRPANSPDLSSMFSSKDLNTPPERDVYSPTVVTEVKTSVEEAPAKKPRKPRAPKTEATKKAASKKPAAVKTSGATKGRRTKSKTA